MSALGWPDGFVEADASLAIVLVPSLGTTGRLFDGAKAELGRRFPEATVVRADLPGHGSGPAAQSVSIDALADDLVAHLAAARPQRTVIVGVSMGGAIALEAARRHPQHISRFVQVNSGARFGSADGWQNLIDSVVGRGTGGLASPSAAGWFSTGFRESDVARALLADLDGLDDVTYIACCRALAEYDGMHDLHNIDVPALLVGTADDRGTPSSAMRDLTEHLARADFVELPTGGHLSIAEHARDLADIIAHWLEKETA